MLFLEHQSLCETPMQKRKNGKGIIAVAIISRIFGIMIVSFYVKCFKNFLKT
jgi:hypothetical protein